MTKQVQIWDKVSPINGVPAEKIVNDWKNVDEVVLILDESGRVLEMNNPAILKQNLGVTEDKTALEIGQEWINYQEELNNKQIENKNIVKELQNQLEEEKTNREQLEATVIEMLGIVGGEE